MEKLKFKRLKMDLTPVQFALNVNTSTADAGYCPSPADFYKVAMIDKTDATYFNNVPFNKGSKRIPVINTDCILKPFNCNWNSSDVSLAAKEVFVDKMSAMVEICIEDIEDSFLVWDMVSGANNSVNPQTFLQYVWEEIGRQVRRDVEYLRWYGDKDFVLPTVPTACDEMTKLTNGYLKILEDEGVQVVGSTTSIDTTNVMAQLYAVLSALSPAIRKDHTNLSLFVASDVALAYQMLQASLNHTPTALENESTGLFLGKYRLVEVPTLADGTIIGGHKQDFVYTYDLEEENFVTVDMWANAAIPTVRFRVNLYFGFDIYDVSNIVYRGTEIVNPT